jgi:hypothetical protein
MALDLGWHRTQFVVVVFVAAAAATLAASCGARTTVGSTSQQRRGTKTVRVGAAAVGKTVGLHVGDHLVLSLGPRARPWAIMTFPRKILSLRGRWNARRRYTFLARAKGRGVISFGASSCGPPRAMAMGCPVKARTEGSASKGLFAITVRVR